MTSTAARARNAAARARIVKADPHGALGLMMTDFGGYIFRVLVHLCIGFALAAATPSTWWGIPLAVLSAATLGRLWRWWRRDGDVVALERLAAALEGKATE